MAISTRRLDPHQFRVLALLLRLARFTEHNIEAVRLVMVEHQTQIQAGVQIGLDPGNSELVRRTINGSVSRAWKIWTDCGLPLVEAVRAWEAAQSGAVSTGADTRSGSVQTEVPPEPVARPGKPKKKA